MIHLWRVDGVCRRRGLQGYNNHPAHVAFVRDRWVPEVAAFMEIDYVVLPE